MAAMVANSEVTPGARVTVDLHEDGAHLTLLAVGGTPLPTIHPSTVLAIDDNDAVLGWLNRVLSDEGHRVLLGSASNGGRSTRTVVAVSPASPPPHPATASRTALNIIHRFITSPTLHLPHGLEGC